MEAGKDICKDRARQLRGKQSVRRGLIREGQESWEGRKQVGGERQGWSDGPDDEDPGKQIRKPMEKGLNEEAEKGLFS